VRKGQEIQLNTKQFNRTKGKCSPFVRRTWTTLHFCLISTRLSRQNPAISCGFPANKFRSLVLVLCGFMLFFSLPLCTVFPPVFLLRPVKFSQSSPKTCRLLSSSSVWSWTKFLVYEQIVVVILSFILLFQGLECTINFTQAPTAKAEIKFQGSHLSLFIRPIAVLVRDFFTWRR